MMKYSERFALGEWVSIYPADMDYDDVLTCIAKGDDRVIVWSVLDKFDVADIISNIENTRLHFENTVDSMTKFSLSVLVEGTEVV